MVLLRDAAPHTSMTENKKARSSIQQAWAEILFEHLGDAVMIHDRFGYLLEVNKQLCHALGYTRDELVGMNVADIDPTVNLDALDGLWARMIPEQPLTVEGLHARKDGTTLPVELRIVKLIKDDEMIFVVVSRDITNRVIAREHAEQLNAQLRHAHRQALAANHARDRLLANMSHELRTPLNAIIGYSEMLQEEIEEAQQQADLGRILYSARHLLELVDDVLDLSHHESRRVPAEPINCDLSILIEDVCGSFRSVIEKDPAQDRGNSFEQVIEPELEAFTDPDKIERIALNLLSNANNFTRDGHISLRLERAGEDTIMTVSDTGVGIADTQQLFLPLNGLEHQDASIKQGKGLGLAICKRYVEILGGSISVESVVGEGSIFTVTIPLQLEERHAEQLEDKRALTGQLSSTVCLSLESCSGIAKSARSAGIQGVAYKDPARFSAAVDALRPDLVVLEFGEAYPDARTLGHKLKSMATTSQCPILLHLYSPRAQRGVLLEGIDDVLFTPMDSGTLRRALRMRGLQEGAKLLAISPPRCLREMLPEGAAILDLECCVADRLESLEPSPTHVLLDLDACGEETLALCALISRHYPRAMVLLIVASEREHASHSDMVEAMISRTGKPIEQVQVRMNEIAAALC